MVTSLLLVYMHETTTVQLRAVCLAVFLVVPALVTSHLAITWPGQGGCAQLWTRSRQSISAVSCFRMAAA